MMKYLTALFITITVLVAGTTTGYAAFPVTHHNMAVVATNATAPTTAQDEQLTAQPHRGRRARRIRGKSQAWALVICCLAGYVGAHRYYLGYLLEGCIQTVTLGGMGVWWIIDLIRICTGDLQPKDYKYMKTF